jgi:hypothetical protein
MRRTVRNKRLAHRCRTLAGQLGALRRYAESEGVRFAAMYQLVADAKEQARTTSENYLDIIARRSFELSGRVLTAEDRLSRIPRVVRWIFRAL